MSEDIAHFTFLPYYRTGLVAALDKTEGDRGSVTIKLKAKIGGGEETFDQAIKLIGPGDLIGIVQKAIVRVDPKPNTNDFEPNYLAAIEFFDEDYPWQHSFIPPNSNQLIPWLALVVFEEGSGEFEGPKEQGPDLPRFINVIKPGLLPPPEQLWAWAHTHLNAFEASAEKPKEALLALTQNPALGCSRIIAPRRLEPNKAYHAFLVPTFEAGRRKGLLPQTNPPNRVMAWVNQEPVDLPIYFDWKFRTGAEGDFEALAARLKAKEPDSTVGRQPMNLSRPLPGMNLPAIKNKKNKPVLELEGALQTPGKSPSVTDWESTSKTEFQKWLAGFINLGEVWTITSKGKIVDAPKLPNNTKLPIVLPPSYGRWHANVNVLEPLQADSGWLEQLNLDISNRVAAAFGTKVVQKHQEDFMARAWKQYGELFEVNRFRIRAHLFRELLTSTNIKHLTPLSDANLLATTSLAHARILINDEPERKTVFGKTAASVLPVATIQPTMRRILRKNGPLSKRFDRSQNLLQSLVDQVSTGQSKFAPALNQPDGRLNLGNWGDKNTLPGEIEWLCWIWEKLPSWLRILLESFLSILKQIPILGSFFQYLLTKMAICNSKNALSAKEITPKAIEDVKSAVSWVPTVISGVTPTLRQEDKAPASENPLFTSIAWNFRQAALNSANWLTLAIPAPVARPLYDVKSAATATKDALLPYKTVLERINFIIKLPDWVNLPEYDPLELIMAFPKFDDPTYEYLRNLSDEYLVSNLSKIENNTVTLLETNRRFIESYLVGLNHEMARELLWRGYPTDQRGSYFRQFWDVRSVPGSQDQKGNIVEVFKDIHPIHGWKKNGVLTELGRNPPVGREIKDNLVFVIRGDLLRRYPNTHVFAVKAVINEQERSKRPKDGFQSFKRKAGTEVKEKIFGPIQLGDDIFGYGFNLTERDVIGEVDGLGWYFVLQEPFSEPRFGLDEPVSEPKSDEDVGKILDSDKNPSTNVKDITWASLAKDLVTYKGMSVIDLTKHTLSNQDIKVLNSSGTVKISWNKDAADMAMILLQTPVRVYFHGSAMLKKEPNNP